jgi:hypothetical protein
LLRNGIYWKEFDAAQLINVIYSTLVDYLVTYETSRQEAKDTLDKRLDDAVRRTELRQGKKVEAKPFVLSPQMASQLGIRTKPAIEGDNQ